MKKPSEYPIVNDLINLMIAVIPWLLPDVPTLSKFLISMVLAGIIVISHSKPNFITNFWNPLYYSFIILAPILSGVIVWGITFFAFNPTEIYNANELFKLSLSTGLGYGVVVGIPLTLLGVYIRKRPEHILAFGSGGCLLRIFSLCN